MQPILKLDKNKINAVGITGQKNGVTGQKQFYVSTQKLPFLVRKGSFWWNGL